MRKGFSIDVNDFIRLNMAQNPHLFQSHAFCIAVLCSLNSSIQEHKVNFPDSSEAAASLNSFVAMSFNLLT